MDAIQEHDIGIVGAGVAGLTAAYELTKRGHKVTVYESRPYAGGLAAGFRDKHWEWYLDRFYHHWFASDATVTGLIDELGARDRVLFLRPTTTVYHQGRLYPLDSPVESLRCIGFAPLHRALRVLQFSPLPLIDRLRAGLVGLYLTLTRDWRRLEQVTADAWMRRAVGERAYKVLWQPLLLSKFGEEHYQEVTMAWMWARLYKRTASLGYFVGGFQAFIDLLAERVRAQGGKVLLNRAVGAVRPSSDGRWRLEVASGPVEHDRVIATCSPQAMLRLAPDLPEAYAGQLRALHSMGAVVLILALRQRLTAGNYWINTPKGEGIPFMGLVEHTNYIPPEHYGGDHLVYCGDYLAPDHPYFGYTADELLEAYLPGLTKINPSFRREWVRAAWIVTEPYAQPIPTLNHSQHIPALRTPLDGLWLANMSQVYPWDRGTNYAVELGQRVAKEVAGVKGAILAIGDELTSGYQLDTNSQEISQRLATVPVEVVMHLSVGDDAAAIRAALDYVLRAADALIVTGGLGPTEDDLTRQVLAAYYGRELVEDREALRRMQERFAARGRPMPDTNRIQAQVPAGCEVIQNDRGTAAGFYLQVGGKHVFAVPGVPFEMRGMLDQAILPRLREAVGPGRALRREALKVYGLPESEINERIRRLMVRGRNPLLGLLPNLGTITVEVVALGSTPAEAEALASHDILELRRLLGHYIISEDGRDLPQVVCDLLLERGLTIAVAEIGTGGLLAARLTGPADRGRWFRPSMVAGSSEGDAGCSEAAALELAAQARASSGAEIGLGVSSIEVSAANPSGRPRAAVAVAVDLAGEPAASTLSFVGDRVLAREWAADAALGLLRVRLLGLQ